jgi:hypothetical protein
MERREIALDIALTTFVAREAAQDRAEMSVGHGETAVSERLIAESHLTNLRARYAALGQRQRHRAAA